MYAHWKHGTADRKAVFELYFRKLPFGGGLAVCAGLERVIRYLEELRFGEEELAYLRAQEERYDEAFLRELRELRFTGSLSAVPEGTPVFPNEPLLQVKARVMEAQLIETALLNFVNFQTLIATKAARVKRAAGNDTLMEFGSRRAQEADAAVWGARAAYIAGFHGTSNMLAGMRFGIPVQGTHAHAWVQMHDSEEEAFRRYAEALPDQVTLLVDTYDTLRSGVPNAIRTARLLEQRGKRLSAIRLDSGDLAALSREARRMLDEAGLNGVRIVASNDLDERLIADLKAQGAKIDSWGVGTKLITAGTEPALGGVYKLVARERNGEYTPVLKISGNPEKVSAPGVKAAYRLFDRHTGEAAADYVALQEERDLPELGEPLRAVDPAVPYMDVTVFEQYEAVPLLVPVYVEGRLVHASPPPDDIRRRSMEQLARFRPETLRLLNPEPYRVYVSEQAWRLKTEMLRNGGTAPGTKS